MDINKYLLKQYKLPPCWELISDVYVNELGYSVKSYTSSTSFTDIANSFRLALHKGEHGFKETSSPVDYCIVLMGKFLNKPQHHIGLYYKGKVLHALASGNLYQDMSSLSDQFCKITYMELVT